MKFSFSLIVCTAAQFIFALTNHSQDARESYQYLHPIPGSILVSNVTTIIVRPGGQLVSTEQECAALFSVLGSVSGAHTGRTIISDDGETIIWKPSAAFVPSETVFVTIKEGIRTSGQQACRKFSYYFVISPAPHVLPVNSVQYQDGVQAVTSEQQNIFSSKTPFAVSLPSDFPAVKVTASGQPDSGYLFMSNMWNGNPYLLIFDNVGTPVFYRKIPGNAYDFKVHPNGLLSYYIQSNINRFYIMDSTYTVIDSIVSVHGYTPNEHELRILPNGHMLLIGSESQIIDMSKFVVGGNPRATVLGNHVVELDAAKNVVFEWRCWDHFKVTDCIDADLTSAAFDYVHMNAVDVDSDGNLLISSRNMSEITKINRMTGKIMWRLGGKNNQFTFTKDPNTFTYLNKTLAFSYQHHIRATSEGTYTLFDNGNLRTNKYSRAVEYTIDTLAMTAEMVWQYRNTPDIYSGWMGSVQRLSNGSTLIGWADASVPKLAEVRPDGTKLLEMNFVTPAANYRVNRTVRKGKANAPYLVAEPHNNRVTLLFNTFGDSDVVQYKIYGGLTPNPSVLIDSTVMTSMNLYDLKDGQRYYFRAASIDSKGRQSGFSNEVSALVKNLLPGENMLMNGNFSGGMMNWQLDTYDSADAKSAVLPNGECFLFIKKGGAYAWSVQLLQSDLEIVNGKKYIFEFDAYASAQRMIDMKVEMDASPWTNYSRTSTTLLPTVKKHFSFPFTMQSPTDYRARVSFNCGISNAYVFLSNIALYEIPTLSADENPRSIPDHNILMDNYPNPFNPNTQIDYAVVSQTNVTLTISDILGREVSVLVNGKKNAGRYSVAWDATGVSSGIYIYTLQTDSERLSKRMMLVK